MELLVIFVIIFIIYGAGWIWQTVNDILRDAHRVPWGTPAGPRSARFLLGGHDVAQLSHVYGQFAEDHHGELQARELFESPRVSFEHHGARAALTLHEPNDSGGQLHTQVTYTLPESWSYRLEVYPQRQTNEAVAGGDLRIGNPEFDSRYVIKSNDDRFAREFLDGAARQAIEDLRHLVGNDQILLSMNSSRLLVRKAAVISSPNDLTVFGDLAGRLHDRVVVFWQRASGIEILDSPDSTERPTCQVCGSEIPPESRVNCRRCGTPHHRDCWEFTGQCSTYACGEKRFATTP